MAELEPPKKGKRGPKGYQPDDADRIAVCAMVMQGLTHDQISKVMKIAPKTLRKHFPEELEEGKAILGGKLARTLARRALSDCKASLFFILKTQYGYRETNRHELTGADGGAVKLEAAPVRYDFDKVSEGALEELLLAEVSNGGK